MARVRSAAVVLIALCVAAGATAATFIVPTDRELVRAAKAIVIAKAVTSYVVPGEGDIIYTVTDVDVEEVIKGEISFPRIQIVEIGGFIGDRGLAVPGTPVYRAGERALIFLDRNKNDWRTWSMGIGKFNFVRDLHGVRLLMRGQDEEAIFGWDVAGNPHREIIRSEEKFLNFVREEACGGQGDASYGVDESTIVLQRKVKAEVNGSGFHACDYAFNIGPFCGGCGACGGKWKDIFDQPGGGGSVNFQLIGSQSGGVNGTTGVNAGMAAWNGNSLSNVNLGTAGSSSSTIHFDDNADTAVCGGAAVGCTQTNYAGSLFTFDTGSFIPIVSNTISFKAAFTSNQTAFDQVACHELGHSIGFRHSDQGTPSTGSAVMVATAGPSFFGANLQGWDTDAVQTMYNPSPGSTCNPPGVPTVSANPTTIASGGSSQLSASATGTSPTFTWFKTPIGDTSQQVGTGNPLSVSPTTTTSYWVRASACSSTQNSATSVTVTVTCAAPTQAVASANPTTVVTGGSSQLSVVANGSGTLTYQWFTGSNPPSGTPISNSNSSVIQVSNLTTTTTFFVHVTNSCGSIDSNTVTVTVQPCTPPTTATASANPVSIASGGVTNLAVGSNGTGPFSYQWFTGNPPNGSPIFGGNSQTLQQAPGATTTYYATVSNACGGPINSSPVTVTVVSTCVPPANAVATATPGTISSGQSSNLTVNADGTGLSIQWFTGTPPGGTAIVGATTQTVPVAPAVTTTYYARVIGQCGDPRQIDSNTVTVVVNTGCAPASITTQPASKTIIVGATATLSVVAAGTAPLSFQWFRGATGDTSNPQNGATSANFTTPALTKQTQYWVRVSGSCGQPLFSNTATVSVTAGRHPAVKH